MNEYIRRILIREYCINFFPFFQTKMIPQTKVIPQFVLKGIAKVNIMHPPSPKDWQEAEVYIKQLEKTQIEIMNFEEISVAMMGKDNEIQNIINSLKLLLHFEKKEGIKALRNKLDEKQRTPISLNQVFLWYSYILLLICQENPIRSWW